MSTEKATRSVSGDDGSPPALVDKKRYHDLDAVRGFAILLGFVIHVGFAIRGSGLEHVEAVIHGFRMQLFFLVSGFFTVMLWRSRGVKELLQHRAKRLLLPIVVLLPFILPLMMMAGYSSSLRFYDEIGKIKWKK